jgi:hypothetical protein
VFRTRTARERQELEANPSVAPTAARQFSRSERLLIRVPVFSAEPPSFTARLVSAFGSTVRELQVAPIAGSEPLYQIDVPLASFAAGSYTVDITARTSAGTASDQVAFRITP